MENFPKNKCGFGPTLVLSLKKPLSDFPSFYDRPINGRPTSGIKTIQETKFYYKRQNKIKMFSNYSNSKKEKRKSPNKKERTKTEGGEAGKKTKHKRMKKSIFISYSPDASFDEKRFVVDLVQQIKENNLAEDIWFDKDENVIDEPFFLSSRLDMVDKCRAIVMLFSKDYMTCPVTVSETKIILERISSTQERSTKPSVFCVLLDNVKLSANLAESLVSVNAEVVDLTGPLQHASVEERTSWTVGALCDKLDKIALIKSPYIAPNPNLESTDQDDWKKKKVLHWSCNDVVNWLFRLQVREFFRQMFAEKRIDGYLLLAATDKDLSWSLGIDSRIVRKKITSELLALLKREQELPQSWHLKYRAIIPRPDYVYLAYDPQDVRLANSIKESLSLRGLHVLSHDKLGQSKEEFLQLNGQHMAKCRFLICLMTEGAAVSPFIFHEILFNSWLGRNRPILTLLFKNIWSKLKTSLKAILGDCPAIDFEKRLYSEAMAILEEHLNPKPILPNVILEQECLERIKEGIQPLQSICNKSSYSPSSNTNLLHQESDPTVFISYQWDVQDKVLQMVRFLQSHGVSCWSDVMLTPHFSASSTSKGSTNQAISTPHYKDTGHSNSLQNHIHENMKTCKVVICCLTPKYVVCQNCEQDLLLAINLHKPVVPVMFQFIAWPPEMASERIKKLLVQFKKPVDFSTDKLFRVNLPHLLQRITSSLY